MDTNPKTKEGATALPKDIFHQLKHLQQVVKVGKKNVNSQVDERGRDDSFPYRTLEDIYAELKPELDALDCTLTVQVEPMQVGGCIFSKATASLENAKGERREVTASAMINTAQGANKYPSQETLASGTMASKSALAGLLLLDNTTKAMQERMTVMDPDSVTQPGHVAKPVATPTAKAEPAKPAPAPAPEVKAPVKTPAPAATPAEAPKAASAPEVKAPEKAAVPEVKTTASAPAADMPKKEKAPAEAKASDAAPADDLPLAKPVLVVGSSTYMKLGIKARNFHGTREQMLADLHRAYDVDDETAETFCDDFLRA